MKREEIINKLTLRDIGVSKEVQQKAQLSVDRRITSMELFGVPYEDLGQLGKWEVDETIKNK